MKGTEGSRDVAILTLQLYAKWGLVDNTMPRPLYPSGNGLGTHCAGGWMGRRNCLNEFQKMQLFPAVATRTPKRPIRSESLYPLGYPGSMQLLQRQDSPTPACKTKGHHWKGY